MFNYFNICPLCKKGTIFKNFLEFKDHCNICKQNFSNIDIGDGASWICMFITSILVGVSVLFLEIFIKPPYWLHLLIWPFVILFFSLIFLRLIKYYLLLANLSINK